MFSWSQARVYLTSWYGLGSGLEKLKSEYPKQYADLKSALEDDPFIRYLFTNVDTSLAASDRDMFSLYLELVEDSKIKSKFGTMILNELELTQRHMEELLEKPFQSRRRSHHYSNKLRASLMEKIHKKQVELLKTWRHKQKQGNTDAEETLSELLLSINALSSAMGHTG